MDTRDRKVLGLYTAKQSRKIRMHGYYIYYHILLTVAALVLTDGLLRTHVRIHGEQYSSLRHRSYHHLHSALPEKLILIEKTPFESRNVYWDDKDRIFKALVTENNQKTNGKKITDRVNQFLRDCFLPAGPLTPDYYKFTSWRVTQRFLSATTSVFGTQSLLLAIGVKSTKIGVAAATTWVLKDALGKFSRIFWASKNGRRFDMDAKRWRFRSSLLFATGNALEIITYFIPGMFLVTAAIANGLKQMAMLTSSSTRNAIYRCLSRNADNIGDITAKGEAQIAVIDLLGMFSGICISKYIGASRIKLVSIFALFTCFDLICIYNEIKSVVFDTLNFERLGLVATKLYEDSDSCKEGTLDVNALRPDEVAKMERVFLPVKHGENSFCNWSTLKCRPEILAEYINIFRGEKFIVTLGCKEIVSSVQSLGHFSVLDTVGVLRRNRRKYYVYTPQILLHTDATPEDTFRSLLVLHRVVYELKKRTEDIDDAFQLNSYERGVDDEDIATELIEIVQKSQEYLKENMSFLMHRLIAAQWDVNRFTFGSISKRIEFSDDAIE